MKRLTAVLILLVMLCSAAVAETWFPYALKAEDDFQTAREVVKSAVGPATRETLSYLMIQPAWLTMYGIPVNQIIVNRPTGTKWRLTILLDSDTTYGENMYNIYTDLVLHCGEPLSVSPMLANSTFDGTQTETSPFTDLDTFLTNLRNRPRTEYKIEFETASMAILNGSYGALTVGLYFENPTE